MNHFITAMILIVIPVISFFEVKKLKTNISDQTKENAYYRIYAVYLISTLLVLWAMPDVTILAHPNSFIVPAVINYLLRSIVTYQAFMLLAPSIMIFYSNRMKEAVATEYQEKEYMFPRSRRTMIMFAVLAFIVGIAEEIIFRGFLYTYFQEAWGAAAAVSFVLVNVIFGLGHYHQGKSAVWDTTLLGLALSYLYINTGSLLLPIIFHILYDLKIVYFTWVIRNRTI